MPTHSFNHLSGANKTILKTHPEGNDACITDLPRFQNQQGPTGLFVCCPA